MRNASDICSECSRRIRPGAPVAIVHEWKRTPIKLSPRAARITPFISERIDRWVCLDCVRSKHETENSFADTGSCEHCGREIRHWDFSQLMPSACCAECRRLAANKRSRERRRVEHEPIKCVACGEMFTPTRSDPNTCSSRCRQKLYRTSRKWRACAASPPARRERRGAR